MFSDIRGSVMEILLHTIDGGVTRLVQDDDALAEQIFQSIHPNRLFSQPHLTVVAGGALHSFSTSAIARIDILTDKVFEFPLPENIVSIRAISTPEFQERFPFDGLPKRSGHTSVFAEFAIVKSAPQFVEITLLHRPRLENGANPIDSSLALQHRLASSVFFFEREGGVALLNSAHLLRMSLYPAPLTPPAGAWVAALA